MQDWPYFGELCALLSPIAWSFAVILFRKTGERVPAVLLSLFKNAFALALFGLTFALLGGEAPEADATVYALLLASGVIGIAVADTCFFACLNRVGASRYSIINTAYSPPIILLSVVFLGERLTAWQVAGVALILSAVLSVSAPRAAASEARPAHLMSGVLFGLAACFSQAVSVVMLKPFMADWPLVWMIAWRLVGGLAGTFLLLGFTPAPQRSLRSLTDRRVWRYMIPGAFIGTYVSLLLWMGGFKFADASVASALNQTATLFTFLLAVLILKEPVTRRGIFGLGLGAAGAALVTFLGPAAGS